MNDLTHYAKINMHYFTTSELLDILILQITKQKSVGRKSNTYNRIRKYFYETKNIPLKGAEYETIIIMDIRNLCACSLRDLFAEIF